MQDVKSFAFKFETKAEGNAMLIEGYGSTFGNIDNGGDVVIRGAFTESLAKRMPKMLWQHDCDDIAGVWLEAYEDENGLYLRGQFAKTQIGMEAYELAKLGALDSMSIGYSVKEDEYTELNGKRIRTIKKCELYEVSFVTFPMNDRARVTMVKNELPRTVREFEGFLRDAGYSQKEAVAIASRGFKDGSNHRDDDTSAVIESLQSLITKLKG